MVKISVLIKRKRGMSLEDFHHYWRYKHGPLALAQQDFICHFTRYVQCHQVAPVTGKKAPDYDGIVELWAESTDEVERGFASSDYKNVIQPDEKNFCDDTNVIVMTTESVVMKG
jgi:uncharacterized protein (TIGR02118 family)